MLCSIRREHSSRSFAPPKKWLISMVTWGIKCARARRAQAQYIAAATTVPCDYGVITCGELSVCGDLQ